MATRSTAEVQSINATGRIGVIPWIDKNTQWVQVQITASLLLPASGNIAQTTTLTGYLELTDKTGAILASPANSGCLAALPFSPPDQPIPPTPPIVPSPYIALAGTFFVNPPVATAAPFGVSTPGTSTDLNSGLPSSIMGGCGFHQGVLIANGGCIQCPFDLSAFTATPNPGPLDQNCKTLTVDLVPGNIEFCIDVRINQNLCDSNPADALAATPNGISRIPIYTPLSGCIVYSTTNIPRYDIITVEVNQPKCDGTRQVPRLQLVFTHVINSIPDTSVVNAGDKIGEVCVRADWTNATCGGSAAFLISTVPVHVAFQLRVYEGGNSYYWPSPKEYLNFLAHPNCLYDRWHITNNDTPVPQLQPTIQACP